MTKILTGLTIAVLTVLAVFFNSNPSFAQSKIYEYFFGSGNPAIDAAKNRARQRFEANNIRIDNWRKRSICRKALRDLKEDESEDDPLPFSNPC